MTSLLSRLKSLPYLPLIAGLTVLRLLAAGRAGLVPDESYYWLWAQHPAFGYYDHPPMVAWWIGVMGWLNQLAFFTRLPFVLSFLVLCWVVFDTAKTLFDETIARRALLWLNACILLSVGCVLATPDPPSVLMWALGLWALVKLQTTGKAWWWLVFGLFAGLGVEAKYTNLFLGLGVFVWLALDKDARRWLLTPWPYIGAALAVVVMAPNLIWNAQNGWITLAKQFGRLAPAHVTAQYLIEFLLSQPILLNPLIFIFVITGVILWWKARRDGKWTLLIALPLPLVVYLLIHVFHDRIQGNWPAPIFPGLIIWAAASAENASNRYLLVCRKYAAPFGITISLIPLLYLALGNAAPALPGTSLTQGWPSLTRQIEEKASQTGGDWIATTDYDTEGELSFYGREIFYGTVVPVAEDRRYAWLTQRPAFTRNRALIVVADGHTPELDACFTGLRDVGMVARTKKAGKKSAYHLYTGLLKTPDCELPPAS